ncbi:hypothetical protein SAMN02910384_00641 [Pseudobutyrivibrio sp. ACV-2]|uniref:hypothetical protein n=1 Tax=Pseudobutyrivibrio sp. ACV-2 TaxID=1520801 RepID=UPI0008955DEC|nr:hypothetical protein [Pseudobutyrivibrio sp. ACV-2]SEA02059.1 hypothetical protein SAMN02910384_00641 [Pseudobutyrivibrio sp. ACV-2]
MKYIKVDTTNILFVLLFLIPDRMIFLVNESRFSSLFHIEYTDFVLDIYLCVFLYVILRYRINILKNYYFSINVLCIIPIAIVAAIVPHVLFGQSIWDGFWAQREFLMLICSYYLFRALIVEKIVSAEYLWNCIYKLSFIVTIVIIVQHFLARYGIQILDLRYRTRFGVRITNNITFSTILIVGSLVLYFSASSNREKIIGGIGLVMAYYHCIFVLQTRIVMVAYGALTIFITMFYRNKIGKKVFYMFIILGLILVVLQSELGQYLLTSVMDSSTDKSALIREIGKELYKVEISKSPLVGRGYPHYSCPDAWSAAGLYDRLNLNDNGMYAFAYIYGFIGLGWYIWITIKMFICSYEAAKKGDFRFLLFTLFLQIICTNIIWWYWKFSFGSIMTLMLAMMEEYHKNILNSKVRIVL